MAGNVQIKYRKRPAPGSAERGPSWVTPAVQYVKGGKGDVGPAGPPAGVPYTFSTTTTMADPGAGVVRFNHATPASVTAIALDDTSAASGNPDVSAWIAAMAGSTNTVKGSLRVTQASDPAVFAEFNITAVAASGGWEQLTVAFVNSAGTLANGAAVQVAFARAGNVGTNGTSAADVITRRLAEDYADDRLAPLFIDLTPLIRNWNSAASVALATVASRDSATQFTVASGHGTRIPVRGSVIVHDSTNDRYLSYFVSAVSGDVVTVEGTLPAAIDYAQCFHDTVTGGNGQHPSRYGLYAVADYVYDTQERYAAYKAATMVFSYNPALCATASYNTYNIRNYANTADEITITRLGGAAGGGYVSGTTNLGRACSQISTDITTDETGFHVQRYYQIVDTGAGKGISFTWSMGGFPGFAKVWLSANRKNYDTTLYTAGRARLKILVDGVTVHDVTYDKYQLHLVNVDLPAGQTVELQFMSADAGTFDIRLHGVRAYIKSAEMLAARKMVRANEVMAFAGDSWMEYDAAQGAETLPTRADGSTAAGMQIIQSRMLARATADGLGATAQNWAKGGMTTKHTEYFVESNVIRGRLASQKKPTRCYISVTINDVTSSSNFATTSWDFSSTDPWSLLVRGSGGVPGNVYFNGSVANLEAICSKLRAAGIQPVILYGHVTASISQVSSLLKITARLADGFARRYQDAGRWP